MRDNPKEIVRMCTQTNVTELVPPLQERGRDATTEAGNATAEAELAAKVTALEAGAYTDSLFSST
jgi:hypothetical protein